MINPVKMAAGLAAGLLISLPGVTVRAASLKVRVGAVSLTSFVGEGTTKQDPAIPSSGRASLTCDSANGPANRALDGVTLQDFARGALASLTSCELRTLESQIGAGAATEASMAR